MNCKNCGGVLEIDSTNRFLRCHYCDSQQLASGDHRSLDEVVASATTTEIFCPSCMDVNQLSQGLLDDVRVAFCSDCFGFMVDSQSLAMVLKNRRQEFSGVEDKPVPVNQESLGRIRNCPQCNLQMETHPYYGPGNAVIDSCHRCRVIWMDNGELSQLVRAPGLR